MKTLQQLQRLSHAGLLRLAARLQVEVARCVAASPGDFEDAQRAAGELHAARQIKREVYRALKGQDNASQAWVYRMFKHDDEEPWWGVVRAGTRPGAEQALVKHAAQHWGEEWDERHEVTLWPLPDDADFFIAEGYL